MLASQRQMSLRFNSTHNKGSGDSDKKSTSSSDYEKSFESLLGQSAKRTSQDESKLSLEEQLRLKQVRDAEEQAKYDTQKAEFERRKQQDFEDMLSGKQKSRDEMNLQDLFKEYYSKAKAVDTKEYVNSAKSSLNSFSSLLEKRRQKAASAAQPSQEEKPGQKAAEETKKEEATQKFTSGKQSTE
jgi:hypothetical protein